MNHAKDDKQPKLTPNEERELMDVPVEAMFFNPFTPKEIEDWKSRFPEALVDVLLTRFDRSMIPAGDIFLTDLLYQQKPQFSEEFLKTELVKRSNEAKMVEQEVGIFSEVRQQLQQINELRSKVASRGNMSDVTEMMKVASQESSAVAEIIKGLAEKNKTMGRGHPEGPSGGGTTPRTPGETPEDPPKPSGISGGCYETYKRKIKELWALKRQLGDSYLFWLKVSQAITELSLCGGPEVIKLFLDMINAMKKK